MDAGVAIVCIATFSLGMLAQAAIDRVRRRKADRMLRGLRSQLRELSWSDAMPKHIAIDMCSRINEHLPHDDLVGGPR